MRRLKRFRPGEWFLLLLGPAVDKLGEWLTRTDFENSDLIFQLKDWRLAAVAAIGAVSIWLFGAAWAIVLTMASAAVLAKWRLVPKSPTLHVGEMSFEVDGRSLLRLGDEKVTVIADGIRREYLVEEARFEGPTTLVVRLNRNVLCNARSE